jgi:hypothetical protein
MTCLLGRRALKMATVSTSETSADFREIPEGSHMHSVLGFHGI